MEKRIVFGEGETSESVRSGFRKKEKRIVFGEGKNSEST